MLHILPSRTINQRSRCWPIHNTQHFWTLQLWCYSSSESAWPIRWTLESAIRAKTGSLSVRVRTSVDNLFAGVQSGVPPSTTRTSVNVHTISFRRTFSRTQKKMQQQQKCDCDARIAQNARLLYTRRVSMTTDNQIQRQLRQMWNREWCQRHFSLSVDATKIVVVVVFYVCSVIAGETWVRARNYVNVLNRFVACTLTQYSVTASMPQVFTNWSNWGTALVRETGRENNHVWLHVGLKRLVH